MSWNESIGQLCTVMLHWRFAPSCFKIKITLLATLVAIRPRVRLKWCYSRRRRSDWRDVESSLSFSFEWDWVEGREIIRRWFRRQTDKPAHLFSTSVSLFITQRHTRRLQRFPRTKEFFFGVVHALAEKYAIRVQGTPLHVSKSCGNSITFYDAICTLLLLFCPLQDSQSVL